MRASIDTGRRAWACVLVPLLLTTQLVEGALEAPDPFAFFRPTVIVTEPNGVSSHTTRGTPRKA